MKYLLKLSKKFLLFMLIIIFPIQSFAAVSVSDGSAFVSKSEFSSTINNISNRMSLMENTLDAKIDSLVSSYLSRNGIWNGDKQKIENSTQAGAVSPFFAIGYSAINTKWSTVSAASSKNFFLSASDLRANYSQIAASNVNRIRVDGAGTYTVINQITKSGLLCVNYSYFCGSGPAYDIGNSRMRRNNELGRSGWASCDFTYGWATPLRWEFIEANSSGVKVGNSLYSISQPFSNTDITPNIDAGAKITYTNITTSFYSFVSKGNKLQLIGTLADTIVNGINSSVYYGLVSYSSTLGQNYGTFSSITILGASVY